MQEMNKKYIKIDILNNKIISIIVLLHFYGKDVLIR